MTDDEAAIEAIAEALADPHKKAEPVSRRARQRARRALAALRALGWRPGSVPTDAQRANTAERELKAVRMVQDHGPQIAPHFRREQWFGLPMRLRARWWDETNFGDHPPSPELMAEIRAVLEAKGR